MLDTPVYVDGILGFTTATPRQLLDKLRSIYCGRIGYEFMHINDAEQKIWLQRRIEGRRGSTSRPKARRRSSTS